MSALLPIYLACPCGARWVNDPDCFLCGLPGERVDAPVFLSSQYGSGYGGLTADINAAKRNGPNPHDDPCGGGPE